MNLFTVITVTYNAEDTLLRTLKSVQEQTYKNIEHIIVDGNSTDGTVELIKKHEKKKTRWISEKDKGIYDAMNKATAMAHGGYICYLNAGDTFYEKKTVEKLISVIQQYKHPDILYGETVIVDNKGKVLHNRRLKAPERLHWKSFKQGMLVCHQAFIIKRSIFEPYDLTYRYSSDVDWCIRLMRESKSIVNTHQVLIKYLNEGVTTANRNTSLKERFSIMTKHYGKLSTILYHGWFVVRAIINPEKK
ncbi:MAG TPA: glycosyltransferase family 2 protein [Dysgonamonadaceae bacterium]|nr:glycosyltransferase family 2 protein [Dysgonamonadaceae bacterium]